MQITVNLKDIGEIKIDKGTTLFELATTYFGDAKLPIMGGLLNNEICELHKKVVFDCDIEFFDIRDKNGFKIYQRTCSFIMIRAIKELIGKEARIFIDHSIDKNYYCEIIHPQVEIDDEFLTNVNKRMKEIVEEDIVIKKVSLQLEEGIAIAKEMGLDDKVEFFKYRRTSNVNFYKLGWFYDYFYGPVAYRSSYINVFNIQKATRGFVIQFPKRNESLELSAIKSTGKLSSVFIESNQWAKILNVGTVSSLNDIICDFKHSGFIRANEALHEKKIASIADMIHSQNKKIVLVSGPSSSGKTTFAERLSIQLQVNGLKASTLSLDNYYLNTTHTPLDEEGNKDFEALEAIDVKQINEDLFKLVNGEKVEIPTYNFLTGRREYKQNFLQLDDNSVLIVEGIHGLNEKVSHTIDKNIKFKIFISALTQLNIDDHNRIPTTDTRLIRRMVRDKQFRGFDPKVTIRMWGSVGRGEEKHIFPFQEEADIIFNSSLVYELCVLKQFAEPLLFNIDKSYPEYTEAKRLLKFFDSFMGISSEDVPKNSILREFIGGSCFH